jgi:hypothetical protein
MRQHGYGQFDVGSYRETVIRVSRKVSTADSCDKLSTIVDRGKFDKAPDHIIPGVAPANKTNRRDRSKEGPMLSGWLVCD